MSHVVPDCPACRIAMSRGFVLDKKDHGAERLAWTEGAAEKSRWGSYETKGRATHALVAFRCPRCAWVIWFAPEVAET